MVLPLFLCLTAAACSLGNGSSAASTSPSALAPSVSPTGVPTIGITPSGLPGSRSPSVTLTGTLSGRGLVPTAVPPCGAANGGFLSRSSFTVTGTRYQMVIEIQEFRGPGVYPAPPARVSVSKVAIDSQPLLLTGTAGSVSVDQGASSGTVEEDLQADAGRGHISAAWAC